MCDEASPVVVAEPESTLSLFLTVSAFPSLLHDQILAEEYDRKCHHEEDGKDDGSGFPRCEIAHDCAQDSSCGHHP